VGSHDPLLEFWDPLISREQFNLETSDTRLRLNTSVVYVENGRTSHSSTIVSYLYVA